MKSHYAILRYIESLKNQDFAKSTLYRYKGELQYFFRWYRDRKSDDVREVCEKDIESFFLHLQEAHTKNGERYSASTRAGYLSTVKSFFRFLVRSGDILGHPFGNKNYTEYKKILYPRSIPEKTMNEFLDSIDAESYLGIRDSALFELMYGTGLRVGEVSHLDLIDVDMNSCRVIVRKTKSRKDRVVPIGNNVVLHLKRYLFEARPFFARRIRQDGDTEAFFLSRQSARMGIQGIRCRMRLYFKEINATRVTCHQIRHSFATHVLERGGKILQVKEILGHSSLETTTVYTQFTISGLRKLMKKYHPRESELYEELTDEKRQEYIRILTMPVQRYC